MSKVLAQHGPHFGFLVVGVAAFLWFAYRPERTETRSPAEGVAVPTPAPAPAAVRSSVARRGLVALGPLVATVATGAILYGIDVAGDAPPGAVIWAHSGISALALLLVVYKVADLGLARIRRAFSRRHMHELVSIVLAALSVPLLVTGVALLVSPSTGSVTAYLHLISSAWWTGLMVWHLRRYLVASLRSAFNRTAPGRVGSPAAPSARAGITAVPAARAGITAPSSARPAEPPPITT
jgi:hypothetical protein